jgi:MFS family permease
MSITLVMDHFNARFPRIDASVNSAAGFWKGLLTAMLELGAMLGAAQAGWLADKFSRKNALFTGFCWFVVGSAIQTGSVAYAMLVVGRLIGGVGIGILSMAAPLYISEISPPNTRGAMLVLEEWSIVFGIIVSFYITYGTRFINGEWSFRLPFLLQVIPALVLMVLMRLLPYSPRWLAGQGRDAEALANLSRLRKLPDTDHRVVAEWLDVRAEVTVQKEIQLERYPHLQDPSLSSSIKLEAWSWVDPFRRGSYKRTLTGIGLMFFQQVPPPTPLRRDTDRADNPLVCWYQRTHILFPLALQNTGAGLRTAAEHVGRDEHPPDRRSDTKFPSDGPHRPAQPPPLWQRSDDHLPCHRRGAGGRIP